MLDIDKKRVKNIHMVGVGGCGMSAIAKILHEMGFIVTGSDVREGANTLRLKDLGIEVFIGHNDANIRKADLIVFSSAITNGNAEIKNGRLKGLPILKRAEMLSWLLNQSQIKIAVAGTHGKTTTTAMLSKVLDFSKYSPTYFIGCDMDYIEGNAKLGNGKFVVTEADESDKSFLYYEPTAAVITNIEEDHLENYGSMQALADVFFEFAGKVADDGFIVVDATNPYNQELMRKVEKRYITYGLKGKLDYTADNMRFSNFTSNYELIRKGEKLGEVELSVPGWQNILNSLAVFAVGFEYGLDFHSIASALRTFIGARRRFQTVGEYNDVLVIDDYAHHPTEIKATLSAAHAGWPNRRLICIFQPHRYSRTMLLKEGFINAFSDADKIIITDIYAASEKPIPGITGKTIADEIKGKDVKYIRRKEKIAEYIVDELKPGDIILTLGAGDIYTTGKEILSRLKLKNEVPKE